MWEDQNLSYSYMLSKGDLSTVAGCMVKLHEEYQEAPDMCL